MEIESRTLSVVIPMYNGGDWIFETLTKLVHAQSKSPWILEQLVVVDDGSTDHSQQEVERFNLEGSCRATLISQENLGRLAARKNGLELCTGEFVLFLDTRVHIHSESLIEAYLITEKMDALTCHINFSPSSTLLGFFWSAAEKIFWSKYWNNPQDSMITVKNFDDFPKGTTCLMLRKDLATEVFTRFIPTVSNLQNASDDTQPLYILAEKTGIFISPRYSATYFPRVNLVSSLRHAYHRGVVFYDGHVSRRSGLWVKLLILSGVFCPVAIFSLNYFALKYCILALLVIDLLIPIAFFRSIRWKPWLSINMYAPLFTISWTMGLLLTSIQQKGRRTC